MKLLKSVGLLLIFTLAITGCGIIQKNTTEGRIIDGKEVIAIVNDDQILKEDFNIQVEQVKKTLEANGMSFTGKEGEKNLARIKETVLESMINDQLSLQQAAKENITVTDEELNNSVKELETYYGGKEALDKYLTEQGMDRAQFEALLRDQMIISKLYEEITANVTVTDEEVKKYFEENQSLFELSSPEIRASHILVDTEEEARKILNELKNGADFAELAKKYSKDPSKENGGDLGFFGKNVMVEEFEKAAFDLEVGEISEPVKTDYGYHIIKVTDKRTELTFDDVKDYIKSNLEMQKKDEEFNKNLTEWQKHSKIEKYL